MDTTDVSHMLCDDMPLYFFPRANFDVVSLPIFIVFPAASLALSPDSACEGSNDSVIAEQYPAIETAKLLRSFLVWWRLRLC